MESIFNKEEKDDPRIWITPHLGMSIIDNSNGWMEDGPAVERLLSVEMDDYHAQDGEWNFDDMQVRCGYIYIKPSRKGWTIAYRLARILARDGMAYVDTPEGKTLVTLPVVMTLDDNGLLLQQKPF
ncbi:MAG: hypothetical protein Q8L79_03140 [Methylobacter sp.]|uniref:hypothetical protein n=1 Tax=Methylobacter sp. TaxID=2051955 RepID=UPI0027303CD1|nr:hypothetical protein [Methylobacter sp.]MDP1664096.1 hypothetical protein [Methylobacter sp.]